MILWIHNSCCPASAPANPMLWRWGMTSGFHQLMHYRWTYWRPRYTLNRTPHRYRGGRTGGFLSAGGRSHHCHAVRQPAIQYRALDEGAAVAPPNRYDGVCNHTEYGIAHLNTTVRGAEQGYDRIAHPAFRVVEKRFRCKLPDRREEWMKLAGAVRLTVGRRFIRHRQRKWIIVIRGRR